MQCIKIHLCQNILCVFTSSYHLIDTKPSQLGGDKLCIDTLNIRIYWKGLFSQLKKYVRVLLLSCALDTVLQIMQPDRGYSQYAQNNKCKVT